MAGALPEWFPYVRLLLGPKNSTQIFNCYVNLLNDIIDLYFPSLSALAPVPPCCVFSATRCQAHRKFGTDMSVTSTLIWYQMHTNTHAQHTQGSIDWYARINIYQHNLLCVQSSYLY